MTRERLKRPDRLRDGSSGIAPRALMNEQRPRDASICPKSFPFQTGPARWPCPPTRTNPAVSGLFSAIVVNTRAAARDLVRVTGGKSGHEHGRRDPSLPLG